VQACRAQLTSRNVFMQQGSAVAKSRRLGEDSEDRVTSILLSSCHEEEAYHAFVRVHIEVLCNGSSEA